MPGIRTVVASGAGSSSERLQVRQRFLLGWLWTDNGFESVVVDPAGKGTRMGLDVDPFPRVPSDKSQHRYFQNVREQGTHPCLLCSPCPGGSGNRSRSLKVQCFHHRKCDPIHALDGTSPLFLVLFRGNRVEISRCHLHDSMPQSDRPADSVF